MSIGPMSARLLPLAILVVALIAAPPLRADSALSSAQTRQVDAQIHDYIIAHPEVIMDSLQAAHDKADAARHADGESALGKHRNALLHDPMSPVMGNPDGDVTLVEFFDYRCPYCKSSAPIIADLIKSDPRLRVVMKEFPVLGPESTYASRVALVAARHGKYAAFHDIVLGFKGTLDNAETLELAGQIGLDPDRTKTEAEDPKLDAIIQANLDLAHTLAIDGTPTFVIGKFIIPGVASIDDLKLAVATARGKS
jgi:protein-disulfide isomerase